MYYGRPRACMHSCYQGCKRQSTRIDKVGHLPSGRFQLLPTVPDIKAALLPKALPGYVNTLTCPASYMTCLVYVYYHVAYGHRGVLSLLEHFVVSIVPVKHRDNAQQTLGGPFWVPDLCRHALTHCCGACRSTMIILALIVTLAITFCVPQQALSQALVYSPQCMQCGVSAQSMVSEFDGYPARTITSTAMPYG